MNDGKVRRSFRMNDWHVIVVILAVVLFGVWAAWNYLSEPKRLQTHGLGQIQTSACSSTRIASKPVRPSMVTASVQTAQASQAAPAAMPVSLGALPTALPASAADTDDAQSKYLKLYELYAQALLDGAQRALEYAECDSDAASALLGSVALTEPIQATLPDKLAPTRSQSAPMQELQQRVQHLENVILVMQMQLARNGGGACASSPTH